MQDSNEQGGANTEFVNLLGSSRVYDSQKAQEVYGSSTLGIHRNIACAVFPESVNEIQSIVQIANRYVIHLYTISRGKNWGYGSALPVYDGAVIVDLSRMNKIINFDSTLGIVTLEPGVTIEELQEYLVAKELAYEAPSIGTGKHVSVIGNTLEKGRSGRPIVDRASALMGLEAVLADESIYRSPGFGKNNFYKWGIGPYIDGLFLQSNLGIVTKASMVLAASAPVETFILFPQKDISLDGIVDIVTTTKRRLGDTFATFKIQDLHSALHKVLSNNEVYAHDHRLNLSEIQVGSSKWIVHGILRGEYEMRRSARKIIRSRFSSVSEKLIFLTHARVRGILFLNKIRLPQLLKRHMQKVYLAALLSRSIRTARNESSDLDKKRRGLLFFSAVFANKGLEIKVFESAAAKICRQYGIVYSLEFSDFSDTCIFCGLLLHFDKSDVGKERSVFLCYRDLSHLIETTAGFIYRTSIETMDSIENSMNEPHWNMVRKIKLALDPNNILSPGRYDGSKKKRGGR